MRHVFGERNGGSAVSVSVRSSTVIAPSPSFVISSSRKSGTAFWCEANPSLFATVAVRVNVDATDVTVWGEAEASVMDRARYPCARMVG
jgi:hypothetical protein